MHSVDKTVKTAMMESWIERYLEQKSMTRRIFLLTTEFESTRIQEDRLIGKL